MTLREEEIEVGGYLLRRYVFHPPVDKPIRGGTILLHGQGDLAGRYGEFLQPFLERGLVCVGTDFPGHGNSQGKRGHIPGIEIVDQIVAANRRRCHEITGATKTKLGIIGHSVGGLLALREILQRSGLYGFSWISSPLLKPEVGQNPCLVYLAGAIGRISPKLTVSTGVTHDQCSKLSADNPTGNSTQIHSRISASWGSTLIRTAREVRRDFRESPPQIPLLFTQGLRDSVSPPRYLQDLLDGLTIPHLSLREFPSALHEPFADDTGPEVLLAVGQWLEQYKDV